ncbi:hypothetical protein LCGC14_1395550 [marine sediment metagenome]|uniref:Uncharacterized protein n=1 Tax=marine sediment metagenome TaxID=412755 RepID=A0A0F9JYQ9_9ZZZZ
MINKRKGLVVSIIAALLFGLGQLFQLLVLNVTAFAILAGMAGGTADKK